MGRKRAKNIESKFALLLDEELFLFSMFLERVHVGAMSSKHVLLMVFFYLETQA